MKTNPPAPGLRVSGDGDLAPLAPELFVRRGQRGEAAWVRTRAASSPGSRARPRWAYSTETVRSVFQVMSTLSPTLT
jgi:hypothetical protein